MDEETFYNSPMASDPVPFEISINVFGDVSGSSQSFELVPGGKSMILSHSNRQEFIQAYLSATFDGLVREAKHGFLRGFLSVVNGVGEHSRSNLFTTLAPFEIEALLCGTEDLDWRAMQQATRYEGGYTLNSPVIGWFWQIFSEELSETERRRFLAFVSGVDRAPVGGLGRLGLVICRNGPDSDRLPTAHTCFITLLLCEYGSQEKLLRCLRTALDNWEGFGLC